MMGIPQIDPTTAATAAATVIFGPELAALAGPYAVIIIGAAVGAAWALGRAPAPVPPADGVHGIRYRLSTLGGSIALVLRLIATAVLLTVAVERGLQHLGVISPDSHWLLGPISLLIGGIGDDWHAVGRWCIRLAGRVIGKWVGDGEGGSK